ncbi:unnamed protein product [Thlaspi arvense]|uniref:Uncharacterized protein n=1 Tax=Thlaspi arvense TaxID=13288 RepID=A0AAU9T9S4_THLAR|nr:unnamed protein product [Thlaspi arvense]
MVKAVKAATPASLVISTSTKVASRSTTLIVTSTLSNSFSIAIYTMLVKHVSCVKKRGVDRVFGATPARFVSMLFIQNVQKDLMSGMGRIRRCP